MKFTNLQPSVWVLLPSVALGTCAITILTPILPTLKAHWFSEDCKENSKLSCDLDLKRTQEISGILSSVRFFIIFLVSPYLGHLSDKIGRLPLLRLNNLGSMLPVLALYSFDGNSAWGYYSAFILTGLISSGTFQITAYVADCSKPEDRPRYFGYLGAVQGFALILTPLFTVFFNSSTLFKISFWMLFINGLWIELVLPESLNLSQANVVHYPEGESLLRNTRHLLKKQSIIKWLALFTFLTALPEQGVVEIVLIYLDDVLNLKGNAMREFSSVYLSLSGLAILIAQTLYIWIFMKTFQLSSIGLMIIANIANVTHMIIYASLSLNHSRAVAYSNIFVTSFMFVGLPASNALLSKKTEANEQGLAMGTLDSIRSFVGAFGPVFFSILYSYFGKENDFPEAPFLFGAAFASLALLVVLGPLSDDEDLPLSVVEPLVFSEEI